MFTLDNFWQILNFIDGTSSLLLDSNTQIVALSEQGVAKNLFENTIDQITFASDDYKRLKNFLVNWYSAHRTIITTQKHSNDIFSLPENHLDELFNSFGFMFATTPLSFLTKANFFLDLVNLYKIKGTPEALITVLQYYGLSDIDLAEYWLEKDNSGDLIFRAEQYLPPGELYVDFANIDFGVMTYGDPHWRLTKPQVSNLVELNKIALPSKSPYFSIRPRYDLTLLKMLLSVVQRHVQDDYDTYSSGGTLVRDVKLTEININASFLELYLSCDYVFNQVYNHTDSTDDKFYCYDGTTVPNIVTVSNQWEDKTKRLTSPLTENVSRETWNKKIEEFYDLFTRKMINNLFETNDPGVLLNKIHSELYVVLNSYISSGNGEQILSYLLKDLNDWIVENIGPGYPNIAATMLGIESLIEINKIIKFFKPYHARLVNLDFAVIENNPLADSIVMEDLMGPLGITEIAVDFDIADSSPCCSEDSTAECIVDCTDSTSLYSARETYDCGSYFDIGASIDGGNEIDFEIIEIVDDYLNYHDATSSNAYDYELFVDTTSLDATADICDGSGVLSIVMVGGWANMDEHGVFDGQHGNDIVEIYMEDTGCTPPPPPPPPPIIGWTITSSLNAKKEYHAGCGSGSDALSFGGWSGVRVNETEIWNGSTWATTSPLNQVRDRLAGCGNTGDALCFGGYTSPSNPTITEIWSGSTWATTTILNDRKEYHAGCGNTGDALCFGGYTGIYNKITHIWNGSGWATTADLTESKYQLSGCGNTSNALCFGGNTGAIVDTTEQWNGSSWATTTALTQAKSQHSGCGDVNNALCFGGHTGAIVDTTEQWNGSIWSTTNVLNQARFRLSGCGDVSDALSFGGRTDARVNTTEIWG